jgi:F0F1-type ATP synthase membrane subunit b/b'
MAGDPAVERLRVARLRVYRQIADLEADFQSGDLTGQDYEAQLRELRLEAAQIMMDEERLGITISDEEQLEREIEAARRGERSPLEGGDSPR